ncbi:MAG: lipid-A-disaccharide synthase [Culturomica sp.]|jgi:lipid-A-disaccharide synthase|nr:lipid-A-disaccharide synthase [Culturomica sp.]
MKYYIIAGEASGDLHASNLIKGLKKYDAKADVRAWGGDLMKKAGADVVKHYRDTAIMGFFTVLRNLKKIENNIKECCKDIESWQPDVIILVDYGGFNMKIARYAKTHNFKVFYYISPKIWAWNTGRIHNIKKYVDRMFVIFPFEKDFYAKYDYEVDYEGNPLVDAIDGFKNDYAGRSKDNFYEQYGLERGKDMLLLMPGSRQQELKNMLPKMIALEKKFGSKFNLIVAGAPSMTEDDYAKYVAGHDVKLIFDNPYRLLANADVAVVTSGTATLETALMNVPQVVVYSGEGGFFYYLLFKIFAKVKYIALPNLVVDREVVKELLMHKFTVSALEASISALLTDANRLDIQQGYAEIADKLGEAGASERFAKKMIEAFKEISS